VSNSAQFNYDYDKAKHYYNLKNLEDLNITDLEKRLVTFVNTNSFDKAEQIAKEVLLRDSINQEAWLVYLIMAKMQNINKPFDDYKKGENKLSIVDYVFFDDFKLKKENHKIADSIYNLILSTQREEESFKNYNYLLFYLSLCIYLNQSFDEAYYHSAQIYQKLQIYDKAEQFYSKVNKNHELYFISQRNIVFNKRHHESNDKAIKYLFSLIEQYTDNYDFLVDLADLYRIEKDYEKAIVYYSKVLNLNRQDILRWRLFYLRGICYERLNNWNLAENDFLESLKINSEASQTLNYLAYAWIERNIFIDRSLKMLEIAHEKDPENHYILDSLAWAHYKKRNYLVASRLMEKVIDIAPGEAISLDHLGDIYYAMGRKREAYYMWKQAKDLATVEDDIIDEIVKKIENYYAG